MKWWGYLLFFVGSIGISAMATLMAFFNPFTLLFMNIAAPLVRLLGRDPLAQGFSSIGNAMWISLLWPLTMAPLHWLNFRLLGWNGWGYAGLLLLAGVLIAFLVLMATAGTVST